MNKPTKSNSHQTAREGRSHVEDELTKRGASAIHSTGKQKIILHASNSNNSRVIEVQVKTKRGKGNLHSNINEAEVTKNPPRPNDVSKFWIFVKLENKPQFWIVPDWWMRNDIYEAHQIYLKKHGGQRPKTLESSHHAIEERRLERWRNKWEILDIFE